MRTAIFALATQQPIFHIMDELIKRHDWWEKGEGLDLWSIPHFVFGILTALAPAFIGISTKTALIWTIILGLLWEVYEKLAHIEETVLNSLFDIILPLAAFAITTYLLTRFPIYTDTQRIIGVVVFIIYIAINTLGWMAYRKRKHGRIL
jgi:hypothetical protein